MYLKTLDATYAHPYFCTPFASACRIRIYETPPNHDRLPTVFVATQLTAGAGTSITNAAEELAGEVIRMQRARRCLEPGDPRHAAVWVQHYPPGSVLPDDPEELVSVVSFDQLPDGRLAHPKWEPVTRSHVEETILGIPLAD